MLYVFCGGWKKEGGGAEVRMRAASKPGDPAFVAKVHVVMQTSWKKVQGTSFDSGKKLGQLSGDL